MKLNKLIAVTVFSASLFTPINQANGFEEYEKESIINNQVEIVSEAIEPLLDNQLDEVAIDYPVGEEDIQMGEEEIFIEGEIIDIPDEIHPWGDCSKIPVLIEEINKQDQNLEEDQVKSKPRAISPKNSDVLPQTGLMGKGVFYSSGIALISGSLILSTIKKK